MPMSMPPAAPLPYDHDHDSEINVFAETNFRNRRRKFGIKTDDRRRHAYVIGKTGMGKTTLLENMFVNDINAGHGVCYIDPHGDTAQRFLDFIPPHRINDVVYFNPGDLDHPVGFNILEQVKENQKHLISAGLMGVFKKIWPDVWSARMEYILLNTINALLDYPGSTLLGITRILSDKEFRQRVVAVIQDPIVKTFWVKEFASWQEKYATEAVAPVQNKVGQFLSTALIRNIVAQPKSTIDVRDIMDNRKILIVNLSKGFIGEENARLLGAMIITRLQLAAMERVDIPKEEDRQDFYLYVDEFQNFATESFANILSEARKYRLNLIVAHQYVEQLDELVRAAIFGNVGTIIAFRVGAVDAELLGKEFAPQFTEEDIVNLQKYDIYLKLMINGAASAPFSATTLPQISQRTGSADKVIRVSRERYATPRSVVELNVNRWSGFAGDDTVTEDDASDLEKSIATKLEELAKSSPSISGPVGGPGDKPKKEAKYEMACSVPDCPNISKLTFEPDKSRPWFCKDHLDLKDKLPPPPRRPVSPPPPRRDDRPSTPPPRREEAPRAERPAPRPQPQQQQRQRPPQPRADRTAVVPPLGSGKPVIIRDSGDDDVRLDMLLGDKKKSADTERPAPPPRREEAPRAERPAPRPQPQPQQQQPPQQQRQRPPQQSIPAADSPNADKIRFMKEQQAKPQLQQRQLPPEPKPPRPAPSTPSDGPRPLDPGETVTF